MFKITIKSILFLLLSSYTFANENIKIISGKASITDGDTIKIKSNKIRLIGIDAPEIKQKCTYEKKDYSCGQISKEWLELFVSITDSNVTCLYTEKDRYKRILGICFLGDKNSDAIKDKLKSFELNSMMVRFGHAVAYRKYSSQYVEDENYANLNKYGIWKGKFEYPWDWRRKNK